MKNYRKLAPGEVIREGDVCPDDNRRIESVSGGLTVYGVGGDWYRLARTSGTPPGWRWADAGETSEHVMGDRVEWFAPTVSANDATGFVMPFPEDERPEEPASEGFWDTNCGICGQLIDDCECAKRGLR